MNITGSGSTTVSRAIGAWSWGTTAMWSAFIAPWESIANAQRQNGALVSLPSSISVAWSPIDAFQSVDGGQLSGPVSSVHGPGTASHITRGRSPSGAGALTVNIAGLVRHR